MWINCNEFDIRYKESDNRIKAVIGIVLLKAKIATKPKPDNSRHVLK